MRPCPKCKTPTLTPISASRPLPSEETLSPSRCSSCQGVWMPHEAISLGAGAVEVPDEPAAPLRESEHRVGLCPAGHGILIRARVEATQGFYLDRCGTCRGIWFDAGEWAAVAATQWVRHLDDLWDPVHQKQMRAQTEREHRLATLRQALGEAVYEQVLATAGALKGHPASSTALAFLFDEARPHGPHE